jgi:hypothetical protein
MTLIEVMLATAILAIGMVVLLSAASRCLAVIKGAEVYQDARHLLAQVELEHPLILEEELDEGSDSGRFRGKYQKYQWRREIILQGEEEDGLYEVTTTISWSKRSRRGQEQVVTYIYFPPEDDGEGSF